MFHFEDYSSNQVKKKSEKEKTQKLKKQEN